MKPIPFLHILRCTLIVLTLLVPSAVSAWTVALLTGSGGLGDESFNDMTWVGLGMAREECNFTLILREWEPGISMAGLIREVLDEGANLIVLNGEQFIPLIDEFAPRNPQILFIANDFDGGEYPNLKTIIYSQHEGAFLAGALASLHSRSKKVGFIGAIDIPIIRAFQVGFTEGITYTSPDTEITVDFISESIDYSSFNNPEQAYQLAMKQYESGVDVIFAVAGVSGNGVINAATASSKFVIGVDADQDHMAQGLVLTSMMKRLDIALYQETLKAFRGEFTPGVIRYGLDNDGISLSPMTYTKDIIGETTLNTLQNLKQEIIEGKITVPDFLENSQP